MPPRKGHFRETDRGNTNRPEGSQSSSLSYSQVWQGSREQQSTGSTSEQDILALAARSSAFAAPKPRANPDTASSETGSKRPLSPSGDSSPSKRTQLDIGSGNMQLVQARQQELHLDIAGQTRTFKLKYQLGGQRLADECREELDSFLLEKKTPLENSMDDLKNDLDKNLSASNLKEYNDRFKKVKKDIEEFDNGLSTLLHDTVANIDYREREVDDISRLGRELQSLQMQLKDTNTSIKTLTSSPLENFMEEFDEFNDLYLKRIKLETDIENVTQEYSRSKQQEQQITSKLSTFDTLKPQLEMTHHIYRNRLKILERTIQQKNRYNIFEKLRDGSADRKKSDEFRNVVSDIRSNAKYRWAQVCSELILSS